MILEKQDNQNSIHESTVKINPVYCIKKTAYVKIHLNIPSSVLWSKMWSSNRPAFPLQQHLQSQYELSWYRYKTLLYSKDFTKNMCVCVQCKCLYWDQRMFNGMQYTADRIHWEFSALEIKSLEIQFWCDCIRTIIDEILCGELFRHQRDSVGKDQVRQIEHACSISEKDVRTPSSRHHLVISYFHALNWASESQKECTSTSCQLLKVSVFCQAL